MRFRWLAENGFVFVQSNASMFVFNDPLVFDVLNSGQMLTGERSIRYRVSNIPLVALIGKSAGRLSTQGRERLLSRFRQALKPGKRWCRLLLAACKQDENHS